ncbi:DUF5131 family protein, partial [Nostoc sp. LEGE 12447]|uniref:DUF5131 family protein n=1 Tax=Nostoc sp. LEGE 12447 TaxID=1828640 RepID=UPI0018847CE2
MPTNIEWADLTDNIIRAKRGGWWCQKISDGCKNCYSEKLNQNSFFGGNKQPYSGQPPELVLDTEAIRKWRFQRKPKKHFVSSMTDVFGEWIPRSWQHEILDGMFVAPKQIFQILTKRPEVMLSSIRDFQRINYSKKNKRQVFSRMIIILRGEKRGCRGQPLFSPSS